MKRSTVAASIAACIFIGYAARLLAADPAVTGTVNQTPAVEAAAADEAPVAKCLSDLRTLDGQMEKEGYWLGASGHAYGYPTAEMGYGGFDHSRGNSVANVTGYPNARPGQSDRLAEARGNEIGLRSFPQPAPQGKLSHFRSSRELLL